MSAPILIVGVGGLGGTIAGHLVEAGRPVVAWTRNPEVAAATARDGLRLLGVGGERTVAAQAVTALDSGARFPLIVLATQPPHVEAAAHQALPHLADGGALVCLQNGLCEGRVAVIAGPERVLGCVVAWGASSPEPGVFERTSAGGFVVGHPQGQDDPRLAALAHALEPVGPVERTDNLTGVRWSKLAINCTISSLGTLGRDRLGVLMRRVSVRQLALALMAECVAVAEAEGVRLEKVSGTLDLPWLTRSTRGPSSWVRHGVLLGVGTKYRRLRSSMLGAIERGREPAVDFLNGEVSERGARHGIATPVNERVRVEVHRLARGEVQGGPALLDDLARELLR